MSKLQNTNKFTQMPVPFINGATIRMTTNDEGDTLFVGKDVCQSLDIKNHNDAISQLPRHLKHGVGSTDPMGREQILTGITEPGLYLLIAKSRKKEAQKFMLWICEEVLPSIRKNGAYISDDITDEQLQWVDENQIIDKLKLAAKGQRVVIAKLVKKILNTHDARYFHRNSYPYIITKVTESKTRKTKDIMFARLIEPIREWGNNRYSSKQLQLTDQFDIMSLLKELEEDQSTFLTRSRSQIKADRDKLKRNVVNLKKQTKFKVTEIEDTISYDDWLDDNIGCYTDEEVEYGRPLCDYKMNVLGHSEG